MKSVLCGFLLLVVGGCFPIMTALMVACIIKHNEISHSFIGNGRNYISRLGE